jgi:ABC-2 type transport system permease protein
LLDQIRAVTPADRQYLIADLFDTITLWDTSTQSAVYARRADGKYEGTLTMFARKGRFDSVGNETDAPLENDFIDVGVLGDHGRFLYLQKQPMHSGKNVVTVTVDGEPAEAGIDPMYKLIDRNTDHNVVPVKPAE